MHTTTQLLQDAPADVPLVLGFGIAFDSLYRRDGLKAIDDRFVEFLQQRNPELHDRLAAIVDAGRRSVSEISRAKLFSSNTVCFSSHTAAPSDVAADRRARETFRDRWLSGALAATSSCDVVFFDPDNGLETPSVPRHSPKAGKYVFLDELDSFWQRGQSLILYHHLNRTASVREQTITLKKRFVANFPNAAFVKSLLFRRGSCRHFWIFGQPAHAVELKSKIKTMLSSGWNAHFELE